MTSWTDGLIKLRLKNGAVRKLFTGVILLRKGNNVLSINIILLYHNEVTANTAFSTEKNFSISSYPFFFFFKSENAPISYPDLIHAVRLKFPQCRPETWLT